MEALMELERVKGRKAGDIVLFALSTCGWCKKTKKFLQDLGVEYEYVNVDLLEGEEEEEAMDELKRWNPDGSFPVVVINNMHAIVGYDPDEIKERLGL
jgi:glutaredoxin